MPQTAKTPEKKPTSEHAARAVDNGHAAADKARDLTQKAVASTADTFERAAAGTADATAKAADPMLRLAAATPAVTKDVTGLWLELVQTQMAQNADAFRRLTAARTWQERVEVHSNYLAGNLARMSEAASRYAALSGTMMQRLLNTGVRETNKAN